MNSYYTNRIEGQHTRPADIERAIRKDFDADAGIARKQRLAIAHIDLEEELEKFVTGTNPVTLFSPALVCDIHKRLYEKLPEADRVTDQGEPVQPGQYRKKDVKTGLHVAPPSQEVEGLMDGWAARYGALPGKETLLIGAACSHHRLAWVHP
ncbi:MAG: Fic family protein, partial [Betaproteobacteria bacterium]